MGNGGAYQASPIRAARRTAREACPPTHTGGPPGWIGRTDGRAPRTLWNRPSTSTSSPLHIARTIRSDSSKRATLVPGSTPNASNSWAL